MRYIRSKGKNMIRRILPALRPPDDFAQA